MNIAVVGTGYVGLVTGACLASLGHNIVCIDIDPVKIAALARGIPGIYEESLEELLSEGLNSQRLRFTTDFAETSATDLLMIAVGTPQLSSGETDLSSVYSVVREAAKYLPENAAVVTKSTVPVGTGDSILSILVEAGRTDVAVASNPEFLRQGYAVQDFLNPDRIVIGSESEHYRDLVSSIYADMEKAGVPVLRTDIRTAELIKYAANAFLSTKLAYVNEMADLCEAVGASIEEVMQAVGLDERISASYLSAGPGFGGSCLPKDIQALLNTFTSSGQHSHVLHAAVVSNQNRRDSLADRVVEALGYRPSKVAVWGLTFKAETDDLRESPSLDLIRGLSVLGARVTVFDPHVLELPESVNAELANSALGAVAGSEVLAIATAWESFKEIDPAEIADAMDGNTIVDLRDSLDSSALNAAGLDHHPIGRSSSLASPTSI